MFYVMSLKDGSAFSRRKLFKHPKVIEKRVQGGLPFCVIETSIYRKRINWGELERICGNFKDRLILPDNIERPKSFIEQDLKSFKKLLIFNTVYELMRKGLKDKARLSMCIIDENGDTAQKLSLFVPLASNLFIKTQNKESYIPEINRAMEEYGARIRFTDSPKADIILNLDEEKCEGRAVLDFPDTKKNDILNLPYCYSSICPEGINKFNFAAFLYKFSKVSALSSLNFEYVIISGQAMKIKEVANSQKWLCY